MSSSTFDTTFARKLRDLPVFTEIDAPDFGRDLDALSVDLFSRSYQGILRTTEGGYTDGSVFVYRNADLKSLVAHPDLGNQPVGIYSCPYAEHDDRSPSGFHELMRNNLFTMQPPTHNPARQLVSRRITAKSVARFRDPMERLASRLVEEAIERPEVDFRRDVADRMMVGFWQVALGWSRPEAEEICSLAATSQLSNLLHPTDEQRRMVSEASAELLDRLTQVIGRELVAGDHALLRELNDDYAAMELDAPGRPEVLEAVFGASLLDGLHSLGAVIASVVKGLLDAPDALDAVRADPDLTGAAFQEGVRLNPAVSFTQRSALRDLTIDGVAVPRGTPVSMAWLLGNRDPAAFPDPGRFRLDRPQRSQTTFGGGFYICPGRNLVRFLTEIVLAAITDRTVEVTRTGPAEWVPATGLHELDALPVAIRRA